MARTKKDRIVRGEKPMIRKGFECIKPRQKAGDTRFWWGVLVVIAAPVYLRAATWVDANGTWN